MSAFPRLLGVGLMRAPFASFRGADGAAAGPVEAFGDVFLIVGRVNWAVVGDLLPDLCLVVDLQ